MKRLFTILSAAALLSGCSTYQGGPADKYDMSYGGASRGVHSETGSGITYKPGMDLRDFDNRPVTTGGFENP